ncbi:MAG: exopolysaccharide biosynthesis protein [Acidobacteria bacterium]|nr:MAG: exopolysaccharide biosynthesis protein [Acidobacteriota bacterium]
MRLMVDIHCHILYGLDDGAESLEVAMEMAEMAIADGITHVVATPHANADYSFHPELVQQRRNEIQARLGDRLTLATGCDFHLSFENLQDVRKDPQKYTINQKNYLLVEFADFAIPPTIDETLHQLHLARLLPIITHPERNGLIRAQPERLRRWVHQGCYVQVTAQSLLGRFGQDTRRLVETWLDEDRIHFFASDAHNVSSRPLRLRPAFDAVAKRRGEAVAQALFRDNPLAALEGRQLPYAPEPLENTPCAQRPRRRKRFFFF